MTRAKYKRLRSKLWKAIGELGAVAETSDRTNLSIAYERMSDGLDALDMLGVQLGYIDEMTNDFTDRRYKMEQGDRMNR